MTGSRRRPPSNTRLAELRRDARYGWPIWLWPVPVLGLAAVSGQLLDNPVAGALAGLGLAAALQGARRLRRARRPSTSDSRHGEPDSPAPTGK